VTGVPNIHFLMQDLRMRWMQARDGYRSGRQSGRIHPEGFKCMHVTFWSVSGQVGQRVMRSVAAYDGARNFAVLLPFPGVDEKRLGIPPCSRTRSEVACRPPQAVPAANSCTTRSRSHCSPDRGGSDRASPCRWLATSRGFGQDTCGKAAGPSLAVILTTTCPLARPAST